MSRFFDPKGTESPATDKRLYAPATARNRDVILDVLKSYHPGAGTLLEIASGTGEHAVHMADHFEQAFWQPSDIDGEKVESIDAWRTASGTKQVLPAIRFNVLTDDMNTLNVPAPLKVVMAANLIHIAPWPVAEALFAKAGNTLTGNGMLFLYGPFKRGGVHTAASNESFDQSLKSRDTSWGVRDLEAVSALAAEAGFKAPDIHEMPANNLSLIFKKT